MGNLDAMCALVTGGGQGIGYAITKELIDHGCNVAIHFHSSKAGAEELKSYAARKNVRAEIFQADLTMESEAQKLVKDSYEFLGSLPILINNTGDLVERRSAEDIDLQYYEKIMNINVTSMIMVTREAIPHLKETGKGSIVNLSSLAGRKGGHGGSLVYATSKGAVLTWTRALSAELGPDGIRVNAVAPGLILGTRFHSTHTTKASADSTIKGIPLGRAGTPEDVARAVAFLAAEYDGFITGATLDINGGVYCA